MVCPIGTINYNSKCVSSAGTINCPAGSTYNSTDALCLCPSGTAFNSNGVCAPVIIAPPPPQNANSLTVITLPKNVTYTTNVLAINAITINSPTTGAVHNISVSIGVSISTLSNSIYNISHGVNSTSLTFGCPSCAQVSGTIAANNATESFEFSTPVANSIINSAFIRKVIAGNVISANSAFNVALLMKQNSSLLKQFASNYTPSGYTPVFNATINQQNSTLVYKAQWLAVSNTASSYVNLSVIKSFSNNTIAQSSMPIAQRAVVPYIATVFNRTNIANRTTSQQLYVTDVLSGNQTTARYVPTNVTTYKTANAVVIGITDVVTNYNDYINIPKSPVPISNMSISVKRNFTVGAISIQTYAASSPSAISKALPTLPGKTASYMYVNSTINDTNINGVNYTFNVTKAWTLQNDVNPLNLSVYRFNSTTKKWVKLPTVLVSSTATSYTYKTNSPGISIYAISGGYLYSGLNTNTTIPTIATTTVQQASSALSSHQLYILVALAIVLVVIVVIYMYVKRFTSGGDGPSTEMPPEHAY